MIGKNLKKNNLTIVLIISYARKEKVYPAYISKHNSNFEKQATFLTIPNGEWWHYITLKNYHNH